VQDFVVANVVEVRRAKIALMAGRTGALMLNGELVYGTVKSVSPRPSAENNWLVKFSIVQEPKSIARKKLKFT
jgi:hypothetical protein